MKNVMAMVGGLLVTGAICAAPAGAQSVRRPCTAPGPHLVTACIMKPAEGATLPSGSIYVKLDAKNVSISPVSAGKADGAHYHLLLDTDLESWTDPIPPASDHVVHLGQGQKEYTFEGVSSGQHRLIVVLGDNNHVPVAHQHADTTYFSVR